MRDRLFASAAGRNKEPILGALRRVLPRSGLVLEIGSGTGQHVAHVARALPGLEWQPSDLDPDSRASVQAWTKELANVRPPLDLDVRRPWSIDHADAVVHYRRWCFLMHNRRSESVHQIG